MLILFSFSLKSCTIMDICKKMLSVCPLFTKFFSKLYICHDFFGHINLFFSYMSIPSFFANIYLKLLDIRISFFSICPQTPFITFFTSQKWTFQAYFSPYVHKLHIYDINTSKQTAHLRHKLQNKLHVYDMNQK